MGSESAVSRLSVKKEKTIQAIKAFWHNYDNLKMEGVALTICEAIADELPEAFEKYGEGLLAHASSLIAGNCNFWLDYDPDLFAAMQELESRLSEDGVRYEQLQKPLYDRLETYPWNRRWLARSFPPDVDLRDEFADSLLRIGSELDEQTLQERLMKFYGSRQNARIHALDRYMRGMQFQKPYIEWLMKEEREQSDLKLDEEGTGGRTAAELLSWTPDFSAVRAAVPNGDFEFLPVGTGVNKEMAAKTTGIEGLAITRQLASVDSGAMFRAHMEQNPFLLTGSFKPGLTDILRDLPLSVLQAFASRHQLTGTEKLVSHDDWVQALEHEIPECFERDLYYFDSEKYNLMIRLSTLNGELRNISDYAELETLLQSGYLFGYRRYGGVRVFLPPELVKIVAQHSLEKRIMDFSGNVRLWMLLKLMSNVYGVFTIEEYEHEALNIFVKFFEDRSPAEIRGKLLEAMRVYGDGEHFLYEESFMRHRDLSLTAAKALWDRGEDLKREFRPIDAHIMNTYAETVYDPENRLYQNMVKSIQEVLSPQTAHLEADIIYMITTAVVADVSPESILDEVRTYGVYLDSRRSADDLLRALIDFTNHTPHWSLRGYSPVELAEDHSFLSN